MTCTPSTLFIDHQLWNYQALAGPLSDSYRGLQKGDPYDCMLTSVPCESNITAWFNILDERVMYWYDLFLVYVLTTPTSVMGILGNVCSIVIFSTNKIANESINLLLLNTAIVEMFMSLASLISVITSLLCFVDASYAISAYNLVEYNYWPFINWFSVLSLDFVTVISIQRATSVILPFRASQIFSYRNTKAIVAFLWLLCILTLVPIPVNHYPSWLYHPYFNKSVSLGNTERNILGADIQRDVTLVLDQIQVLWPAYRLVVDVILLLVTIIVTLVRLKQQSESRSGLKAGGDDSGKSEMSTRELKAMKMSLAICIVTFLNFFTVGVCSNVAIPLVTADQGGMTNFWFIPMSRSLGGFMYAESACFNFFLYMIMSPVYRDAFKRILKAQC